MNEPITTADEYRGYFISEFAKLERAIDLYLAQYFVQNDEYKTRDLIGILIDRIPFGEKRAALRVIFDIAHQQSIVLNLRGNSATYSKIIEESRKSAIIRNYFAHYHSVIPNHQKDAVIGLIQFRDSTSIITFTKIEFDKEIEKIKKTRNALMRLISD